MTREDLIMFLEENGFLFSHFEAMEHGSDEGWDHYLYYYDNNYIDVLLPNIEYLEGLIHLEGKYNVILNTKTIYSPSGASEADTHDFNAQWRAFYLYLTED